MSDATPMTRDALATKMAALVESQLYHPNDKDTPLLRADFDRDGILTELLPMDSLDQIEVIMAVEDEFDIEISDEVAEGLTTLNKLIDHVAQAKGVTE